MGNFLLGLSVGLAAGLLLAPKTGEETREYLTSKAGEGADYLKQRSQELADTASDAYERGLNAVKGEKDKVASSMENRGAYQSR